MMAKLRGRLRAITIVVAAVLLSFSAVADPRVPSRAEAEAARLVAAHLMSGPGELWNATASTSKLRKLGAAQGAREIEIRVGPSAGAEWELVTVAPKLAETTAAFHVVFPSGIDDTIVFTMVNEGGALKVGDIRSLADPVGTATPAAVAPAAASETSLVPVDKRGAVLAAFGLLALVSAVVLRKKMRVIAYAVGAVGVIAWGATGALVYMRHAAQAGDTPAPVQASLLAGSEEQSRELMVGLRKKVTAGDPVDPAEFQRAAHDDTSRDRALVWRAQLDMQKSDLKGALGTIARLSAKERVPMAHLLEGRIAFLENRDVDAVMALERAMELGPERDDLLHETATILMTLGFDDRAKAAFRRLAELGSREANVYYSLAMLEAIDGSEDEAEAFFLKAYALRPELRSSLIRVGVLYSVLRRPKVLALLKLSESAEPLILPAKSAQPLQLPPGVTARARGDEVEIDFMGGILRLPGGAAIAPANVIVQDAGTWEHSRTERALGEVASLSRLAAQPASYAQPALTRRIEETAEALVERNRWNDVVSLTNSLSPATSDLVPVDLLLMKALAHQRSGQSEAAKTLLTDIARKPSLVKRLNAWQLLQVGELLASLDAYEAAIRIMDRAAQMRELPHIDDRVRQLALNKRLTTYTAHETEHFTIRYSTDDTPQYEVQRIGEIAEAEFKRLQRWIPINDFRKVTINVLSWQTFRGTYTGTDHVLGFYDGKITVPLAGVGVYPPEIVAILSHELAHAMIAQRTRDQAPRWFQEGLAQRIEGVRFRRNPFNMYDPQQLIALAVLDDVITYSPDPERIGQGYLIAQALVRYVETKWGNAGLVKMLDAYAAGRTTEEALEGMTGLSLASFDAEYMKWGSTQHDIFENKDVVSYEAPEISIRKKRM